MHCKPARGSYRISLKKFCRKDYGRPPALTFSPCPFAPWASHCRLPRPVSSQWPLDAYPHPSAECPLCASLPHRGRAELLRAARPLTVQPRLTPPPLALPAAVQVAVGARGEARGSWTRFPVAVLAVFRSGEERARRGSSTLWVPARDAACGCPRLLPGRRYLLLGGGPGTAVAGRGPGLSATRGSLVLPWRDAWTRRLRRLQRRERRGRCGTA